jgi:hypothetical protein
MNPAHYPYDGQPMPDEYLHRRRVWKRKLAYLTAHYPYSGRHMYFAMAAHARRYGWADY